MERFKSGQKAFSLTDGDVMVKTVLRNAPYCVIVETDLDTYKYTKDGKSTVRDKHPSLFHSIEDAINYLKEVSHD